MASKKKKPKKKLHKISVSSLTRKDKKKQKKSDTKQTGKENSESLVESDKNCSESGSDWFRDTILHPSKTTTKSKLLGGSDSDDDQLFQPKKRLKKESDLPKRNENKSDSSENEETLSLTQRNTELNRRLAKGFDFLTSLTESQQRPGNPNNDAEQTHNNQTCHGKSAVFLNSHPKFSDMEVMSLKPSMWTKYHTVHALTFNMASYVIDCHPYYDERLHFYGERPKIMETPVSLLLTRDNKVNDNDVFLSDDDLDDNLVEFGSDQVKLIPPDEIVLERGIIS